MNTASKGASAICLGTSPAMLFEGLRRARLGEAVTFVDRADDIGGGWRTRDLFGFAGVEVGAHLFENRRATLDWLHDVLAPDELVVDESGFGLVGKRRIGLRAARGLLYGGLSSKALARRDRHGWSHSAGNLRAALAERGLPLVYPAGGIAPLLRRLRALLSAAGARFRFGVEVERIEPAGDGVVVRDAAGEAWEADQVVISSRAHAPVTGLEEQWQDLRGSRVDSLVMLLGREALAFSGYVEIFSNPVIKRVRRLDISGRGSERPLAVFQARAMAGDAAATARTMLDEAARLGLVHGRVEPEALHHETVRYRTLPAARLAAIERAGGGRIATLATVDFSDRRPR